MGLTLSTFLFALLIFIISGVIAWGPVRDPELWKKLPRHRNMGGVLALICLIWCAAYALPMFEGAAANFRLFIKLLVPAVAVLSYFFLSYIFARGLGGILVLSASHLLAASFAARPAGRAFYALFCYLFAATGLIIIVCPWLLRDLLEKAIHSKRHRLIVPGVMSAVALIMAIIATV